MGTDACPKLEKAGSIVNVVQKEDVRVECVVACWVWTDDVSSLFFCLSNFLG